MAATLIRADKWTLTANTMERGWTASTQSEYRAYVRALIGVVWTHWPSISGADSQCHAVESLIHATAKRPCVRYAYFDRRFRKFPSYLRRAAIRAAVGQVMSFVTRHDRWQGGLRGRRSAAPPKRTGESTVNLVLYRGQSILFDDSYRTARLKLWNGSDWVWTVPLPITGKRQRHTVSENKLLSPTLLLRGNRIRLAVPFRIPRRIHHAPDAPVCAVDLGINTTATASIVHSDGTVAARRFIRRAADIDRRDRGLAEVRAKARKTAKLSRGFCRGLYRKAQHRNLDMSRRVGREIVKFAMANGASVIVFEHLKGWRPRGGRHGSTLRQRFHGWLHRAITRRVMDIAEEVGLHVATVDPRNTSALAFDGSGMLVRDAHNAALARFPTGKQYNADLNASYNIGARYFYFKLTGSNGRRTVQGKSSQTVPRTQVTLSTLWALAPANKLAA